MIAGMGAGFLRRPVGGLLTMNEAFLYWLTAGFIAALFLPPDIPIVSNILVAAMVIVCMMANTPGEKSRLMRRRGAILFMLGFFILQLISAAISADRARAWSVIAMRSPLLIFPLVFGGIYIRRQLKDLVLLAYSLVIFVISLCCLIDAVHRTWVLHDTQWLYDDSLTKLIGRTAVYMALVVSLAIFSLVHLVESRVIAGRGKLLAYAAISFMLVFHFLLASRTSMFFLYGSLFAYACWRVTRGAGSRRTRIGRALTIAGGGLVVAIVLFCLFPKTLNRFRQLEYLHYDYHNRGMESHYNMPVTPDQWNSANFRLAVWNCGLDIARHHLLTGVPLGDKQAIYRAEYKSRGFMFALKRNRNLHNTWLDVLVNTGIPGLLFFLLGYLVLPLGTAMRNRDWLGLFVVGAFGTAIATETWIDSSFGSILLGYWLSLVIAWQPPEPAPAELPR